MDTNTTDRSENPAAPSVGTGDLLGLLGALATIALMILLTLRSGRQMKSRWEEVPNGSRLPSGTRFCIAWPVGVPDSTKKEIIDTMTIGDGEKNVSLPTGSKIFRQLS